MYTGYGKNNRPRCIFDDDVCRVILVLIVLCSGIIVWGIYKIITYEKFVSVEVSSYYWYRGIDIQQWMEVQESDWHVPAHGREIRSYRAKYDTESYKCGTETRGTGKDKRTYTKYCYRDVYRTKYDYMIDRWIVIDRYERQGVTQDDVIWPDIQDLPYKGTKDNPLYGDKRAGQHISRYVVIFRNDGTRYDVDMVESLWYTFEQEKQYQLKLGFFGNIIEIIQ